MKPVVFAPLALASAVLAAVQGFDISSYQHNVDFASAYKAGPDYHDPDFPAHHTAATKAGFIRGTYHLAHPDEGTGAAQANYFVANGGGWTKDGITLPGMLDLESESGHKTCWGLSSAAMVSWIKSFSDEYHAKTGRYPMLYTSPSWWQSCTDNSHAFQSTNPLVLANHASGVGSLPGGWPRQTIWQNSDSYKYGGDLDVFNGDAAALTSFAKGS